MQLKKRWAYSSANKTIGQSTNVSQVISALLTNRGLITKESIEKFLHPKLDDLTNPLEIPGLEKGTDLIIKAIQNKEKIVIYGDYDVDGITATAILVNTLKELGGNVSYYIPHRYHEGYSLNLEAISNLAEDGAQWMITVDCGISNPEEIKFAESKGIKVIVTDHHNPPEILPEAEALINPKLGSKDTPFYSLSGVGVAFKLAQALYQKLNNNSALAQKYLDLVAMGTVADVVPLIGENRILTYFGLKKLSKSNWPGVELLKSLSGIKKEINTRSIGYILGPRINAAGRIEDAGIAVDLLLAKSEKQAKPLADKLNHLNYKRREIGAQIFDDTLNQIQENKDILNNKVIILSSDKWHPGVTGIVASQLVRKYNRPTVLITLEGDTARGSIRSPDGIGIFDALRQCQDLFINYGGHQEAAGFEIDATKVTEFQKRYTSLLNTSVTEEMLIPEIKIDLELPSDQISIELVQELNCLAPFGQGNSLPIFSNNSLEVLDFRQVGDGTHLKLTLKNGKKYFDGIGFGLGEYAKLLDSSEGPWEFAFSLGVNEWNGQQKTELTLYDIRPK